MEEKVIPVAEQTDKALPEVAMKEKKINTRKVKDKTLPPAVNAENCVKIGDKMVEIKATKLKYHRNNTASFYRVIEMMPLPDILQMDKNAFGDGRDGDKALMDWLIAVTDDEQIILDNYNDMDTETVETMLAIFKRVNKISEKEEKQKNARSREKKG